MKSINWVIVTGSFLTLILFILSCDPQGNVDPDPNPQPVDIPQDDIGTDTITDFSNLPIEVSVPNPADYDIGGIIDFSGDEDYYRIYADSAGVMEIIALQVPSEIRLNIAIYDAAGDRLGAETSQAEGQGYRFDVSCLPGWHFVLVRSSSSGLDTINPYIFQVDFDFEDVYEPNPTFFEAAEIPVGEPIHAKIRSAGDIDFYTFTLDQAGVMTTRLLPIPSENSIRAEIYNDQEQNYLKALNGTTGQGYEFDLSCVPGKYYIKLRDGTGKSSSDFYQLLLMYDTSDAYEPNNSLFDATEISLGDTLRFKMADEEDIDYFKVVMPESDTLDFSFFSVPGDQGLRVILYDEIQTQLSTHTSSVGKSLFFEKELTSTFYFSITDNIYDVSGRELYEFVIQ